MLERDLLNWIIECAERTGWKVWHVPAPMVADKKSGQWRPFKRAAGLPDLFLLHDDPPRMVIAEVKGDKGKLSEKQREFLTLARGAVEGRAVSPGDTDNPTMVRVYAWTPADQPIIEQILKSKVLL